MYTKEIQINVFDSQKYESPERRISLNKIIKLMVLTGKQR